jgi:hypothetical protein
VGIPVTAGRRFATSDTQRSPGVAIVNAAFVRDLLGGRSPLALRVKASLIDDPITVVGVAGDTTPAGESDRPALYVPLDQLSTSGGYLIVRAEGDPRSIVPALTRRLRTVAPALAADRVSRVAESLEASRAIVRFSTQVAALFAGLALLLSLIAVYGLTAGEVSARWRELAVRLALGASRGETLWTVIRPCAALLAAGSVLGIAGAASVGPALASLLRGVDPADAPTLIGAPLLLGAVGLVAALLAARRVLRADPATILRNE